MQRLRLLVSLVLVAANLGCATAHEAPSVVVDDLACAPSELRSAWWSAGGAIGLEPPTRIVTDATHMMMIDRFWPTALRLDDGTRMEVPADVGDLHALGGVLVVQQRLGTLPDGRSDYVGITDVLAIGTSEPVLSVPWIFPPDAGTYTQVRAHLGRDSGRVVLLERAVDVGGTDRGIWIRSFRGATEQRLEISGDLPSAPVEWEPQLALVFDEVNDVAFVTTGWQVAAVPSVTRIELATGAALTRALELGPDALVAGHAVIGERGVTMMDLALSHDGTRLLVTTRDGVLRTLDAASLESAAPDVSVGVVMANPETYLPSLRSPVAFSERDGLVAMLDASARLVIADASTMHPLATLPSEAPLASRSGGMQPPRPLAVRFLPDGVLVVTDEGVERFRCGG